MLYVCILPEFNYFAFVNNNNCIGTYSITAYKRNSFLPLVLALAIKFSLSVLIMNTVVK